MSDKLPRGYRKKIVNPGPGRPLTDTFTADQVEKRISFFRELNEKRERLERSGDFETRRFALYGFEDTTTVRVYMRETVLRIAAELFFSNYSLSVENVYVRHGDGSHNRDYGHVQVTVCATRAEIDALLEYLEEGSSYYVYDGERARYVAGNTEASQFIIVKPDETMQPVSFWRRSQSYLYRVEEIE
jgi:hypothetical protein